MAGTHSRLSASGAPAYVRCLGKPNAEEGLSEPDNEFSAEGTLLHDIAAMCLEWDLSPHSFVGAPMEEAGFTFTMDEGTAKQMQAGLDYIAELAAGNTLVIERRVSLAHVLGEGEAGTTDVGIASVSRRELIEVDWKWGAGVQVEAEENEQLMLYALGLWEDIGWLQPWDCDWTQITVRLVILQPRVEGGGGEWTIGLPALMDFGERMKLVAQQTRDPAAPRTPGEKQCRFCKRAKAPGGCYALTDFNLALLDLDDQQIDEGISLDYSPPLPRVNDLTPERRAYIVLHTKMIEQFLATIHAQVMHDAKHGSAPTPGLKVVIGRSGPRTYVSESETAVEKILLTELTKEQAYTRELISPTQAEKLLSIAGYTKLDAYVKQSPGRESLVPEGHKKQAVQTYVDMLDETDEHQEK